MKYLYFFCLLILSFSCTSEQKTAAVITDPEFENKVDALVQEYVDLDIFSGVVMVAEKGEALYHKAFGLANRATNVPNTLETRFDIGSMNKTFTKVVALQLIQEDELELSDPVGKYLEGFPTEAAEKITIEHLLNHQSGYGDYHTPDYWELPLEEKSLQRALQHIQQLPLLFEPGAEQEYSNAGYVILGLVIEAVTGKSYFDVVEERIVEPLNMKDTYLREKYQTPNRAIGYFKNMRGELEDNDGFAEIVTPAGGFYSTTSDMQTFYQAFYYGDQLWDDDARKMDEMYDFYEEHQTTGGAMTHAGGFEGANTVHYEILRDHISVIVFANMDEIVAENLGAGILAIIRGKDPEAPALPAVQAVYQAFQTDGIDYVKSNWEQLTKNFHPADPKDLILNNIGYNLLFFSEVEEALQVLQLNAELFPEVANVWDSYGEALAQNGQRAAALEAYQKALAIDPELPSAKAAVANLKE